MPARDARRGSSSDEDAKRSDSDLAGGADRSPAGAGVSQQARSHRHALRCRRSGRCAGALDREQALQVARAAVHRRRARRRLLHHRHRHRGQVRARRLHAAVHYRLLHPDRRDGGQPAVRPGARFRAANARRQLGVGSRRRAGSPGEVGTRAGGARAQQSRQAEYASSGTGGILHLYAELLEMSTKADMRTFRTRAGGPSPPPCSGARWTPRSSASRA